MSWDIRSQVTKTYRLITNKVEVYAYRAVYVLIEKPQVQELTYYKIVCTVPGSEPALMEN